MNKFLGKALAALMGFMLVAGTVTVMPEVAMAADPHKILVGATLDRTRITYWEPKLQNNMIMRIFPDTDGTLPVTTDSRIAYAHRVGMKIIFVSTKLDKKFVGDGHGTWAQGLADTKTRLQQYVDLGWFDQVWYSEHHEGEADYPGSTGIAKYKSNQLDTFDMVDSMTSTYRAKVKVGSIFTRQWIEDANKGNFDYSMYDTGWGDFFGVDMYASSYTGGSNVITSPPNPDTFLQYVKAYKYPWPAGSGLVDTRFRFFPELGMIGYPADTNGGSRGQWMRDVHTRVKTWNNVSNGTWNMPWNFDGWIWWNDEGTGGSALNGSPGIGTARYFELDQRHTGTDLIAGGTNDKNGVVTVSPAHALNAWNSMAAEEADPNF